jgi:serine/threonine-protein kinase
MFIVLVLAVAGVEAGLVLTKPAPTYAVPALKGDGVAQARGLLASRHLQLSVVGSQWDPAAKGSIVQQSPQPGVRLHAKATVSVTVSRGPQPVAVPDLATLDQAQASVLKSGGLRVGTVSHHTSMTVPNGVVVSWSPQGNAVLPGTAVNLVISAGKPTAIVPGAAAGTTFAQADASLRGAGFYVDQANAYSNDVPIGQVISMSPPPGTSLVVGTTVTVTVSLGPRMVTVPSSVVGLSVDQAESLLSGLGIGVDGVQGYLTEPVTGTVPTVGTQVRYGAAVQLVTG